jgi:hypothetical protein
MMVLKGMLLLEALALGMGQQHDNSMGFSWVL